MAEPSLSLTFVELRRMVAHMLGYGRDDENWTDDQVEELDEIIGTGLQQFYFPPPLREGELSHDWSFLKPIGSITTAAPYSTGTVTVVAGVVTLASGTFPSWAASGKFILDNVAYSVASRDSNTQITLDDTSVAAAAGTSYELNQEDYDAPDAFGFIEGDMTFRNSDNVRFPVRLVAEAQIRSMRQANNMDGAPQLFAYRVKNNFNGTSGQRYEFMFWPTPDAAYVGEYAYGVLADALTTTAPYPFGGMTHGRCIMQACKAAAELHMDDEAGPHTAQFMMMLRAAISQDLKRTPEFLGYNGDRSDGDGMCRRRASVTYNGNNYP